jgi:hypothetical protein
LIIVVLVLLFGGGGFYGHRQGYYGGGGLGGILGLLVVILICLFLFGGLGAHTAVGRVGVSARISAGRADPTFNDEKAKAIAGLIILQPRWGKWSVVFAGRGGTQAVALYRRDLLGARG